METGGEYRFIKLGTDKTVGAGPMMRCTHCGAYWQELPGSGRLRGFCRKCMGPLCGKRACFLSCTPWEKQFEETLRREALSRLVV